MVYGRSLVAWPGPFWHTPLADLWQSSMLYGTTTSEYKESVDGHINEQNVLTLTDAAVYRKTSWMKRIACRYCTTRRIERGGIPYECIVEMIVEMMLCKLKTEWSGRDFVTHVQHDNKECSVPPLLVYLVCWEAIQGYTGRTLALFPCPTPRAEGVVSYDYYWLLATGYWLLTIVHVARVG